MPVRAEWFDDEKTIYISIVEGSWTLDEFYKYYTETEEIIKSIPHPVVLISDLSKSGAAPKQFLSAGRFMSKRKLPNVHLRIVVGVSRFGQTLINIMLRTYPSDRKTMIAATMDEAIKLAQQELERTPK
jgi:hypothetical protein